MRDATDLDRLVLEHLPAAFGFAVRLTGGPDAAEDLVQEAMLRVARAWPGFRGESSFRTWFFRIVVNVFRDTLRRPRTEALPDDFDPLDERGADPLDDAMARELGDLVAGHVSTLPPRQREVLVLSAYEGMSVAEISFVLGISKENTHATLHLARARLKTKLAAYFAKD